MRRGLVGHHVRHPATGDQLGQHVGAVGDHGHRQRPAVPLGRLDPGDAVVQGVGDLVEVAVLEPALRPPRVHLDAQGGAAVAGDRQRLRAAHAAEAAGEGDRAGQGAAEVLVGDLGEGRVGALQDPLGADVDPRAGGHLAVHHQALVLELAEVLRRRPPRHQQRVGDQHPRRALVGAHHADRLAATARATCRPAPSSRSESTIASNASQDRARPGRCRRRRPGRPAARRPPGRGCCAASAARPRRPRTGRSSRCRAGRGQVGLLAWTLTLGRSDGP